MTAAQNPQAKQGYAVDIRNDTQKGYHVDTRIPTSITIQPTTSIPRQQSKIEFKETTGRSIDAVMIGLASAGVFLALCFLGFYLAGRLRRIDASPLLNLRTLRVCFNVLAFVSLLLWQFISYTMVSLVTAIGLGLAVDATYGLHLSLALYFKTKLDLLWNAITVFCLSAISTIMLIIISWQEPRWLIADPFSIIAISILALYYLAILVSHAFIVGYLRHITDSKGRHLILHLTLIILIDLAILAALFVSLWVHQTWVLYLIAGLLIANTMSSFLEPTLSFFRRSPTNTATLEESQTQ